MFNPPFLHKTFRALMWAGVKCVDGIQKKLLLDFTLSSSFCAI